MAQRYHFTSFLITLLLLASAGLSPPQAIAQCTSPTITEDVENINPTEIRANGWETFGTSISDTDPIDGAQSFLTSGANGNPNDNRVVRTPYVTIDGDVCVEFEYLPISPGPNTFVRVGLLTRDDTFYELEEVSLAGVTTLQAYQRTFTATEISNAAGTIDRARISIEFNGDNAGGRRLKFDNVAITETPVYDQGGGDYSNRAPTPTDDMYMLDVNTTVQENVLTNDSDPDILDGIDTGPLQATRVVTQPENGTVTLNTDGSFEYTASATGTDSFVYEVCDNGFDAKCAEGTATFDVALPVELASFTATADARSVILRWTTLSETGNEGFDIEQKTDFGYEAIAFVEGQRTTTEATLYSFRVSDLEPGEHTFRLRQVDIDGDETVSDPVSARVAMDRALTLQQTGQNPFRTQTTLEFAVNTAENVTIDLFDVLGRRVRTLYTGTPTPGRMHSLSITAQGLAPGRYLIRARTPSRQVTQPITVVQ